MKKTKLLVLLLAFFLVLPIFVACDSEEEQQIDESEQDNAADIGSYLNLNFYSLPDGSYGVSGKNTAYLDNISIPSTYQGKPVTQILKSAFIGANYLKSVTIPKSVTSIGDYAFSACRSITSISIPECVTSIGVEAFSGCSNLKSINIPEGVTSICNMTFYKCSSLESITIPKGVESIGYCAFDTCSSLESITIPDTVTSIDKYAFDGCSSLKTVYYTGTEEEWASISIGSYNLNLTNATIIYNYVTEE